MVRRREQAGQDTKKKEKTAAPVQQIGKQQRIRRRPVKALFASAQRANKRSLGMTGVLAEADAFVAMGRILDEVCDRVVQRYCDMAATYKEDTVGQKSAPTLQPMLAMQGIASFVPLEKRDELRQWVNKTLDAYCIGEGEADDE